MGPIYEQKTVSQSIPFPDGYPTIVLPRVSLRSLLESNEAEIEKLWEICISTGFFYLNLVDHPHGLKLWNDGIDAYEVGLATLPKLSMKEKLSYKSRERLGVFDTGYKCPSVGPDGEAKFSEAFNVPLYEMAVDTTSKFELPSWLKDRKELFVSLLKNGNQISDILLGVFEKRLGLSEGQLTKLHRFNDPSNDFLRVLRYPGTPEDVEVSQTNFPPHRDSVSIAMLFTWVGGLQILDPSLEEKVASGECTMDDAWRWVKPMDGHVIVNLGDALSILTNGLLKSGFHRVITGPGAQKPVDKYSVLLGYRPALITPMVPLKSPIIPKLTPEQERAPILTCEQWGAQTVSKAYRKMENR